MNRQFKKLIVNFNNEELELPEELSNKIQTEAIRLKVPLEVYLRIFMTEIMFAGEEQDNEDHTDTEDE